MKENLQQSAEFSYNASTIKSLKLHSICFWMGISYNPQAGNQLT